MMINLFNIKGYHPMGQEFEMRCTMGLGMILAVCGRILRLVFILSSLIECFLKCISTEVRNKCDISKRNPEKAKTVLARFSTNTAIFGIFWKPLILHRPHPVGKWNFAQTFHLAIFHKNRCQKSCEPIRSTVFQTNLEVMNKLSFPMSGEKLDFWRVWHAFSLAVNTSDNLSSAYIRIDNRVVYSNNSKYKVAFSSDKFPVKLSRKNSTVHLHYFIHGVRQACQTYYRKRGSVSYIVREVHSVRERERERYRERKTEVTSPLSR